MRGFVHTTNNGIVSRASSCFIPHSLLLEMFRMKQRGRVVFFNGSSSINPSHDLLDPLRSPANDPPTESQIEILRSYGVDPTGKNPGSAAIAIAQQARKSAIELVEKHDILPGVGCLLDGEKPATVRRVGDAPPIHFARGAVVLVHTPSSRPASRWVHPKRLSEFKISQG